MIGLLGTSNSLVWGIDECVNTHHFIPIKDTKMTKNTQIYCRYPWFCVFMCFRYKGLKTWQIWTKPSLEWKRAQKAEAGKYIFHVDLIQAQESQNSPWIITCWQKWSLD